jgi:hypothetical protein
MMQDERSYGTGGSTASPGNFGGAAAGSARAGGAGTGTGAGGRRVEGVDDLQERADRAMDEAAETLESAAERIDRLSDRIPQKGVGNRAGALGHSTADTLESLARFLRDNDVAGLQRDLGRLVSGRPLSMLLLAVGAGFVAGKVLR